MKFLLDQDVWEATRRFLVESGHDAVTASNLGCSQSSDIDLLLLAHQLQRILVTRDRDFGELAFVRGFSRGILYLRILPSAQHLVHQELDRVLKLYPEEVLNSAFVVVEPGRHRMRRFPESG